MKRSILYAAFFLSLMVLSAGVAEAQTATRVSHVDTVYASLVGSWTGKLTYRDYTTDKMTTLPTTLHAERVVNENKLRLHYVYDDGPNKTVEETETIAINPVARTYTVQTVGEKAARVYRFSGLETFNPKGEGILTLSGAGTDNGKKTDVRNTLTRRGNRLTLLHETHLPNQPYRFRSRYEFSKIVTAEPQAALLTAAQLQADFAIFEKAYKQLHPGLYRYNTPEQMEANFQALKKQLGRDQSVSQAYLAFAAFLAKIKCGHSYPNFYNQPRSIVASVLVRQPRIPFYFRWIGQKMIVTRPLSPDAQRALAPGTEVVALNGVSTTQIQSKLLGFARADGSNDAKRVSDMEVRGDGTYEAFDVYFPLLFPLPASRQIPLLVKLPKQTKPVRLILPAMTPEQRLAVQKQDNAGNAAARDDVPAWEFRFLGNSSRTAYLRMPTWALFNSKWDWKGFIDDAFAQMAQKKTEDLILDLRGNEGGMSIGNTILSKLVQKDLPLPSSQRWVRYHKVPDDLAPYLDTWDDSFKDWGNDIRVPSPPDTQSGFFRMTRFDDGLNGDVIHPDTPPFLGKTYVIVGAVNSSATFEFAQIVQQNHLATLVGQPTGGNQRGINGGAFFFLRLPNSKIETDIPLISLFPAHFQPTLNSLAAIPLPDAGLVPDIPVTPSVEDIQAGIDTELTAILKRLQK